MKTRRVYGDSGPLTMGGSRATITISEELHSHESWIINTKKFSPCFQRTILSYKDEVFDFDFWQSEKRGLPSSLKDIVVNIEDGQPLQFTKKVF